MLKLFRVLSIAEGLSLLTLFFVAMPAKYHFAAFDIVWPVGMTHGVLWLSYLVISLMVSHKVGWNILYWLLVLFISIVPFAFILLDKNISYEIKMQARAAS